MTIKDLKKGDIILSNADIRNGFMNATVSWVLKFFEGGEFNHASIYMGLDKDGVPTAMEATARKGGVNYNSVQNIIDSSNELLVKRLKITPTTMEPVLSVARSYHKIEYNIPQIFQLALICLHWKLKNSNWIISKIIKYVLLAANSYLLKNYKNDGSKFICSDFVYNSYMNAVPVANGEDNYKIELSEDERLYFCDTNIITQKIDSNKYSLNKQYNTRGMKDKRLINESLYANIYGTSKNLNLNKDMTEPSFLAESTLDFFNLMNNVTDETKDSTQELDGLYKKYIDESNNIVGPNRVVEVDFEKPTENFESLKPIENPFLNLSEDEEQVKDDFGKLINMIVDEKEGSDKDIKIQINYLEEKYKDKKEDKNTKFELKTSGESFINNINHINSIHSISRLKNAPLNLKNNTLPDGDFFQNYNCYFGRFVTARDLNEAINLEDIERLTN